MYEGKAYCCDLQWMNDLASKEGQLSCLGGQYGGQKTGGRDLSRIRGEDAVDLLPYLELAGREPNCH